jgi:hypothetical protein
MDMHEFKYLTKKGVESVNKTDLKKCISKCYNNFQVCEFEGRGMVMSLTTHYKIHCVRLCMQQHKDTKKMGLKTEDTNELAPD